VLWPATEISNSVIGCSSAAWFAVSSKMREGRFDKVYNLRKGDQLVDFYEHFKTAHAGVVTLEKADIAQLEATIAAAEGAGLGDHDAVKALRDVLARKEKSLE